MEKIKSSIKITQNSKLTTVKNFSSKISQLKILSNARECGCGRTKTPPYCDGSHSRKED